MSCPLSVHLLFLGGLLQTCFLMCVAKEYYVTPTQPSNFTCPTGEPCHTLIEYAINSTQWFKGQNEVSLLFGSGIHYLGIVNMWNLVDIVNLTLMGLNSSSIQDSPHIIKQDNNPIHFKNISILRMEYLTVEDTVYNPSSNTFRIGEVQNFIQNNIQTIRCSYFNIPFKSEINYDLHNTVNHQFIFLQRFTGSVLIQNSIFTNSSHFYSRGQGTTSSFLLRNVTFHDNSISHNNFLFISNLTIDNCYFERNTGNPSFFMIGNSNIYFKENTTFANNIGVQGGAMHLVSSYLFLEYDSNITFINNSVTDVGGGIYTDTDLCVNAYIKKNCFYQLPQHYNGYNSATTIKVFFINNTAEKGGDHVYGASLKSGCSVNDHVDSNQIQDEVFQFINKPDHNVSRVASKPDRVCLCDEEGQPQCANFSYIVQHRTLTPGEKFNLSVAVVGGDFGTVTGVVYATFTGLSNDNYFSGNSKPINSPVCTSLEYSVHSSGKYLSLIIGIDRLSQMTYTDVLTSTIVNFEKLHFIDDVLRATAVLINIYIQDCPVGLTLYNGSYTCECVENLIENDIDHCIINNSKGLVYRNETTWIDLCKTNDSSTEICFSHHCPNNYCKTDNIPVDLNDSNFQCELSHVGILCGSCPSNLSLALGSSQCLDCTNDGGLALVIVFLVAGPALVFFIKILDLTVSWGTINGLIMYANIMWINKDIHFLSHDLSHSGVDQMGLVVDNNELIAFKVFIAWLNLDFGIERCFFQGLNAYWKTWLQFVFPIYLWIIVLTIIVLCRYSTKLTRVFGNNIVSVLATLFLMSYIKLLRTIVTVFGFAILYSQDGSRYVWLLDGTVPYFHWHHVILFVTAVLVLTILILPYTLTLLCVPYLKRKSDYYLLSWINKCKPIFDVYYGPLKDKCHYWIGVTLLIRVFLALLNAASQTVTPNIILATTAFLSAVMWVLVTHVYKRIYLSALECFFLMNLILLCVSSLTSSSTEIRTILACGSIGVSFLTFLGILICHTYIIIKKCRKSNSQEDHHSDYQRLQSQTKQQTNTSYGACNRPVMKWDRLREPLLESVSMQ